MPLATAPPSSPGPGVVDLDDFFRVRPNPTGATKCLAIGPPRPSLQPSGPSLPEGKPDPQPVGSPAVRSDYSANCFVSSLGFEEPNKRLTPQRKILFITNGFMFFLSKCVEWASNYNAIELY